MNDFCPGILQLAKTKTESKIKTLKTFSLHEIKLKRKITFKKVFIAHFNLV